MIPRMKYESKHNRVRAFNYAKQLFDGNGMH